MIKIEHDRDRRKLRAIKPLNDYLDYLEDTTHEDHEGMILMPGRNYNCGGTTRDDFVDAVIDMQSNYLIVREGESGKRSADLWGEIIYNLGKGVYHTPEEREKIERKILSRIAPNTPARCYWHVNPDGGYDDLHIVIAAKNLKGKMALQRTATHTLKRLKQLDGVFATYLNIRARLVPKRQPGIKPAHLVAKEKAREKSKVAGHPKPSPLAKQIAMRAKGKEVTAENLPDYLNQLGITVLNDDDNLPRTIHVLYTSRRAKPKKGKCQKNEVARTGVLNVRELLLQIAAAILEILRAKKKPTKEKPTDLETPNNLE